MRASKISEILESLGRNLPGVFFYRFIRHMGGGLECDFISENIVNLTGHSAEEIIKNPSLLKSMVLPEYLDYIAENTENSFRHHTNFEIELECNSINDGIRWMKVLCIPEILGNGDVIWFGIQTDITHEKKITTSLSKSNHELRLLNNINDILTNVDDEQAVYDLICNCLVVKGEYKLAWIGHSPDENSNDQTVKHISAFGAIEYLQTIKIDLLDPKMRLGPTGTVLLNGGKFITNDASQNIHFKPWLEAAQKFDIRSSIVLELDIYKRKRSVLNIYSSLVNAFDDNEVSILERMAKSISTAVKNIHIEIEKQKAQAQLNTSEANLKSIFDHTEVGYVLLDLNYTTISFNQALQNIFKFQNQNELKNGEHFLKNIGGEKSDHYSKIFTEVINNNTTIKYETKYLINNEEYYYYNVVVPVKSGDSIIGICLSKVDITNRKKEELLREKVTDELMQRNRDLEQFAYIISHNLRAPVANILGLNLLLNDHPNENDKNLIINKISGPKYLQYNDTYLNTVWAPLQVLNLENQFNIVALTNGRVKLD